jgi:hypothetical protein
MAAKRRGRKKRREGKEGKSERRREGVKKEKSPKREREKRESRKKRSPTLLKRKALRADLVLGIALNQKLINKKLKSPTDSQPRKRRRK